MTEPIKTDTNCPKTSTKPSEVTLNPLTNDSTTLNTEPKKPRYSVSRKGMGGRPTKYRPKYCKLIIEFFTRPYTYEREVVHTNTKGMTWTKHELCANAVPLMCEFAHAIGTVVNTLAEWEKKHIEFKEATTHAQHLQLAHLNHVTGLGLYNSNWAVFMGKNISNWRDKKDIEHSGTLDSKIFLEAMIDKSDVAEQEERKVLGRYN